MKASLKRWQRNGVANNDFNLTPSVQVKQMMSAQSLRVTDFLRDPARFGRPSLLRFGIEGFSEARRKWFGKPIRQEDIYRLVEELGARRIQAQFFFILGLPGDFDEAMEWAAGLPPDRRLYPRIFMKGTLLEPSPHTPLWTMDATAIEPWTQAQWHTFFQTCVARNSRFRKMSMRSSARGRWRMCIRRCTPEDTLALGPDPGAKMDIRAFESGLFARGLGHLLVYDGRPMPSSQIVVPSRALRDRRARALGMPDIVYRVADGACAGG